MEITDSKAANIETQPKPLLSIDEQIEHLKSKGVTFNLCPEEEARHYLSDRTYFFKIAAFRTLFDKRVGGDRDGQYIDLDFEYLKVLASFDRTLRYALLPLTLDVEHAAKTKLLKIVTERQDEDGYSITRDYMLEHLNHNERRRREGEISRLESDAFCGGLVRKYGKPEDMPVWVFLEVISFGTFVSFYLFCGERWGDRSIQEEHYMLRQAQFIRNACAHSSNLINGFRESSGDIVTSASVAKALAKTGLSHRVRTSKMRNSRLKQMTTLLFLHSQLVVEGTGHSRAAIEMDELYRRIDALLEVLDSNDVVRSSLNFLRILIDKWFR